MIAWLVVYGPKYVFHTGQVVPSAAEKQEKERLTQMELNRDIAKLNEQPKPAPKPPPKLDRRALEQLQAMQRANEAAKAARQAPEAPAPAPAPAPSPAPAPPAVAQTQPPAPAAVQSFSSAPSGRAFLVDTGCAAPQHYGRAQCQFQHCGCNQEFRLAPWQQPRLARNWRPRRPARAAGTGAEILSDTRGVDFTEYIKRLLRAIKAQWLPLIPEECYPPLSKEGTTLIRFTIDPDGKISAMNLDDSTHDRAIDHAAWGAITGVGQFAPLPKEFSGPNLELRITLHHLSQPPPTPTRSRHEWVYRRLIPAKNPDHRTSFGI